MFTMLHSLIKTTPTSFTRLHGPTGIDKRSSSNDLYICIQSKYIYQKITDNTGGHIENKHELYFLSCSKEFK